jgi:hypothetical protein
MDSSPLRADLQLTAWHIPLDPANQERRKSNRETLSTT